MAGNSKSQLDDVHNQRLDGIDEKNEYYKQVIAHRDNMTPLQTACSLGNKEAVQILLARGADVEYTDHDSNYTSLHYAALFGNADICRMLLDAGINPSTLNCMQRTALQVADFVGNYACVETINNYIPKPQLISYTTPQGLHKEPLLPATVLDDFHKFVVERNLHPVRIALNLINFNLQKHMPALKNVLELMYENELKKTAEVYQPMALKFHYLSWIIGELLQCEENCKALRKDKPSADEPNKHDFVEIFIKRVLKENKLGQLDYIDFTVRHCVQEFPFRLCGMFRNVTQPGAKDAYPALRFLRACINGQRRFADESIYCSSCGNEKPDKKCSKCKAVQYCDRECQRLHWFMHKKTCKRPTSATATNNAPKAPIDASELHEELARMNAS